MSRGGGGRFYAKNTDLSLNASYAGGNDLGTSQSLIYGSSDLQGGAGAAAQYHTYEKSSILTEDGVVGEIPPR